MVDPIFGTLDDFDRLLARAHRYGLKVVIDQVYALFNLSSRTLRCGAFMDGERLFSCGEVDRSGIELGPWAGCIHAAGKIKRYMVTAAQSLASLIGSSSRVTRRMAPDRPACGLIEPSGSAAPNILIATAL